MSNGVNKFIIPIIVVAILAAGIGTFFVFQKPAFTEVSNIRDSEPSNANNGMFNADQFGIYTSNLNGKNLKLVIADPYREMNHVRVSPDKQFITFTRFNNRKIISGFAEEEDGYTDTEIMIAAIDGTGLKSLTPTGNNLINVNSYWTPDGKSILYMSNDNPDKTKIQFKRIDLATRKVVTMSPADLPWVSDPHQVGNHIVFPAARDVKEVRSIWLMKVGSQKADQITHPVISVKGPLKDPLPGDSDPKLSPDGTEVAFTRHFGNGNFHNIVLNLATGKEKDLSVAVTVDVMPEWSSDGRLLTFWHVNLKKIKDIGIYTIKPDGSGRTKIPLPYGYFFRMPAFFPGEGSGSDARVIFSGKRVPQIK